MGVNYKNASSWANLVDKIWKRLAKWEDKQLSFGGRITLIQSVLLAISIYCLSFYHVPKNILSELVRLQRSFFGGEGGRKYPQNSVGKLGGRLLRKMFRGAWDKFGFF